MKNASWLREIPLLSDFSDQDIENLAASFHKEKFPNAAILIREGEPGDRFALILRGEVEVIQGLGTPEERLLARLGPGEFLGEMSLIDPSGVRSASARARGPVEWAQLSQQDFNLLLERQPNLGLRLLRETISRLRRSESATIRDLKEKNLALAQAYHELQQAQAGLIEKERLEHELEIARVIQQSILPKEIPDVPGWQISAHWQPAKSVSGDFYDIFAYPDGRLGILIADVSGKGMPAALVMATTCSILRAVASAEISPGALLERVNLLLFPYVPSNVFVTCLYGVLNPASGYLRFANAGHNLPVKITDDGVQELRATGMPLGLLPGMTYLENEASLQPGDGLLLYTDGMVEAHNGNHEMFGLPRLYERLAKAKCDSSTIDLLLAELAEFTGPDWEQEDDVTFVVLSRSGESSYDPVTIRTVSPGI